MMSWPNWTWSVGSTAWIHRHHVYSMHYLYFTRWAKQSNSIHSLLGIGLTTVWTFMITYICQPPPPYLSPGGERAVGVGIELCDLYVQKWQGLADPRGRWDITMHTSIHWIVLGWGQDLVLAIARWHDNVEAPWPEFLGHPKERFCP